MQRHLFVYGTLMRAAATAGMGGPERQRLWSETRLIGPATVSARLYDFGAYPGVVLVPATTGALVHGEVLDLTDPVRTFAWLDRYEMIVAGEEATSEYARIVTAATLGGQGAPGQGASIVAWIYVTQNDVSARAPIDSGRWM